MTIDSVYECAYSCLSSSCLTLNMYSYREFDSVLIGLGSHDNVHHQIYMNSMKTCPSVTFHFMKNSLSDTSRKWILPNMIRAELTF